MVLGWHLETNKYISRNEINNIQNIAVINFHKFRNTSQREEKGRDKILRDEAILIIIFSAFWQSSNDKFNTYLLYLNRDIKYTS
jgi:hypothetical protein